MSIVVTAREVPEFRGRMAAWARDPGIDGAANWFNFRLGPHPDKATESRVFDLADDVSAIITGTLAAQLPVAELFYVSDEMTELAAHAATTLTDYRLTPRTCPRRLGSWPSTPAGRRDGYRSPRGDHGSLLGPGARQAVGAHLGDAHPGMGHRGSPNRPNAGHAAPRTRARPRNPRLPPTTAGGPATTLIWTTPSAASICGVPAPIPARAPTTNCPTRRVRYRHRWIVRGHWLSQFYPRRGDHRPIWIDPRFAGPADKRLLGGDRVNVLRR